MKEFLMIFRTDYNTMPKVSADEAQAMTKKWMDWMGSIAAQNKLSDRGKRLTGGGKVLYSNKTITDGPYTEIKESVGGFSVLKAESYEEAVQIAKGCPILTIGGNVEIREIDL